ncbi:MAG: hypothetical protein KC731_05500, partial [Myxococcales bacterium]|nr:hypothetical protein [Myxococcales bacterium]
FGILGVKASEQRRCSAPLVVSVAFEGARWRAGRIMAGTTVSVIDRTGADVVVGVHGAAITLTKGATLLASSAEVDACPLLP